MNRTTDIPISDEARALLTAPLTWQKGTPIYVEIYRRLHQLIAQGVFKKGDRLPSETELAALMNVGRTSLRSAIILLFEDGFVKTFHGRGTYVTYDARQQKQENETGFLTGYVLPRRRLAAGPGTVSVVFSSHHLNSYDAFLNERLQLGGASVNTMTRLFAVDGAHAVLAYIYYPAALYDGEPVDDAAADEMLERYFDDEAEHVHCTFTAVPAGGIKNADAGLHFEGSNFLLVSSLWYDAGGKPLAYCKDYYCSDVMRYRIETGANKQLPGG